MHYITRLSLLQLVLFGEILGVFSKHHVVPTYFGRRDRNGALIDATDPSNWFKIKTTLSRNLQRRLISTLHVEPPLVQDGRFATVTWKDVDNPSSTDIIALYCPEKSKNSDYLDYFSVQVSPTYKEGRGVHLVRLYNVRTNCEFRYFRTVSKDHQELEAVSNIVMFEGGPEMPLQLHLALTGDPTQMRVMWVSGTDETPIVQFGTDKSLGLIAKGKSQTYSSSDFCFESGKFIDPGFIHDVVLTGLKLSTVYYYSCGVLGHMSAVRSFKTAPAVGDEISYKFIVYGDMGIDPPAAFRTASNVFKDVKLNGYEFIFHNGDISYATGYAYIWDQWFSLIQPYSSIVPYMVGIGNHEQDHKNESPKDPSGVTGNGFHPWWGNYGDDSNGECGVPMFYRFHMPDNGNYVWWYSYDYGIVHFIMMSTEHDMGKGSRQYAWLENDLKNVDRSKTPWIILGGHRPMYTSQVIVGDVVVALGMQTLLEELLHEHRVDLALWAHYHSYERTCALYKSLCLKDGTVHVVIGTGGKKEDSAVYVPPWWSKSRRNSNSYGYGRVAVANRSALHFEYFVNSENRVVDDFWLFK